MSNIVVVGDVAIDCHVFRTAVNKGSALKWNDQGDAWYSENWGGAALLFNLLKAIAEKQPGMRVDGPQLPPTPIGAGNGFLRSYALWELVPREIVKGEESDEKVWRVRDFLGMRPAAAGQGAPMTAPVEIGDVVVIDDANLETNPDGFCCNQAAWPQCIKEKTCGWVVWKLWRPRLDRPLGEYLLKQSASRLVLILSANGLRESGIYISKRVSWERTAQELYTALATKFSPYTKRQAGITVIVSLGMAGAFIFQVAGEGTGPKARLIYDAKSMEEEWENNHPGRIVGNTSCLTAGVAIAVASSLKDPDFNLGVKRSLEATRCLLLQGFEKRGVPAADPIGMTLDVPFSLVADRWAGSNGAEFQTAIVPDPNAELVAAVAQRSGERVETGGRWTILGSRHGSSLYTLARDIAVKGAGKSLADVPMVSYGKLDSVDRREIEGYRNIFNLFNEYELRLSVDRSSAKPVSIAVFGPPGSGKSFGVKQIAKGQLSDVEDITFNLSQFSGPSDLIAALHRVRDSGLRGKLPLVFWDEFDTALQGTELGWLRYFLEPMQDGIFLEGQTVHPIGPAIFIFAGGTRDSFARFNRVRGHSEYDDFRAAKGPDFISRLRGFLDILGPNPRGDEPAADPTYVVRRAILFRSIVKAQTSLLKDRAELDIDPGVLHAFLTVSVYKHGARSMESIVASSALADKGRFDPSSLPQRDQLDLHVPAWEFMTLLHCAKMVWEHQTEHLAQAFHDNYCDGLRKRGYTYAPKSDDEAKKSSELVNWDELSLDSKEENRNAVRSIPDKLALSGYVMVPSNERNPRLSPDVLERLAELEHERWLRSKIAGGWRSGPKGNRDLMIHEAMLPWRAMTFEDRAVRFPENAEAIGLDALPEQQKEKDRDQVNGMVGVLTELGFTLVESTLEETRHREVARARAEQPCREDTTWVMTCSRGDVPSIAAPLGSDEIVSRTEASRPAGPGPGPSLQ